MKARESPRFSLWKNPYGTIHPSHQRLSTRCVFRVGVLFFLWSSVPLQQPTTSRVDISATNPQRCLGGEPRDFSLVRSYWRSNRLYRRAPTASQKMMRVLFHSQPSHAGRENQDAVEIRRIGSARLVALADGQGGRAGGAKAARVAVGTALDLLESAPDPFGADTLRLAISVADEAVEADEEAGFSTLIVVVGEKSKVAGASAGDSLVLHITDQECTEPTERQRKNPPVGSGGCVGTPFQCAPRAGEQLLLMSDGVFRWVGIEAIAATCRDAADAEVLPRLLSLHKRSENGDLPDDWSAILLRF